METVSAQSTSSFVASLSSPYSTPVSAISEETASANLISGSLDIAVSATTTIDIDGIKFTVKNKATEIQSFSYSRDTDTGKFYFNVSNVAISVVNKDISYDIELSGSNNTLTTGNLADKVTVNSPSGRVQETYVYGGAGDDTLIANGTNIRLYGQDGDDNLIVKGMSSSAHGNAGDDTIYLNYSYSAGFGEGGNDTIFVNAGYCTVATGNGDNTVEVQGSNNNITCGSGADDITIKSGDSNIVDGGAGTNTIVDNGTNTSKSNVPGANTYSYSIAANAVLDILVNGIEYSVKNYNSSTASLLVKVNDDNSLEFSGGSDLEIIGQKDKQHNVILRSDYMCFHGGDLNDVIDIRAEKCVVYGGAGDDTIYSNSVLETVYGEDGDDTIYVNKTYNYKISGGNGDDTIYVNSSNNFVQGDDGDDTIVFGTNVSNNAIVGGSGNNTISGMIDSSNVTADFADSIYKSVEFTAEMQTKDIIINGVKYTVTAKDTQNQMFLYGYNDVTGKTVLGGANFSITCESDKEHNLNLYGSKLAVETGEKNDTVNVYSCKSTLHTNGGDDEIKVLARDSYIYGGDGNDFIETNVGYVFIFGEEGDDTIKLKSSVSVAYGGNGNDIYELYNGSVIDSYGDNVFNVYGNNLSITAGTGNDTFNVYGNNNVITGQGGDDYFVVSGNNNNLDGGTGVNIAIDTGTNNSISNVQVDPNSGTVSFVSKNQVVEIEIAGNRYVFENTNHDNTSSDAHSVSYSFNPFTNELLLEGDDFTLNALQDKENNIKLIGNNNVIKGGSLNDTITVKEGSNNYIYGNDGDDTLVMDSANNSLYGDNGNDVITINASTNKEINAGHGDDTIRINASNNINIQLQEGKNTVTGTGSNNTISANDGNNSINLQGDNNSISTEDGNNKISLNGNNNNVITGNGDNTIGLQGSHNEVTTGDGKNTFNVYGSNNSTTSGAGNDIFNINGNQNTISAGAGEDKVTITGDKNVVSGGDDNDKFIIKSGNLNEIDGNEGDNNTLLDKGMDTIYSNVNIIKENDVNIRLQIGANKEDYLNITLGVSLDDLNLDFSTAESAVANIDTIDNLMTNISTQMSQIGAMLNRLESIENSQTTTIENYTAAKSTIMDADIAEETAKYAKQQILQQTTVALIASAQNINSSIVMQLIGHAT